MIAQAKPALVAAQPSAVHQDYLDGMAFGAAACVAQLASAIRASYSYPMSWDDAVRLALANTLGRVHDVADAHAIAQRLPNHF